MYPPARRLPRSYRPLTATACAVRMTPRLITLLAVSAATIALAACGSESASTTSAPAASGGSAASAAEDASLALGQRAVSPFVDYGTPNASKTSKVAVKVLRVRKGAIADFKDFQLDRKQRRSVPYYIDAKFENLGRFALSRSLLRASVEDTHGTEYRPLNMIVLSGTFKPCPEYSDAKLRPGDSFTGCSAILLPNSAKLDLVRFQGDVTKDPLFWEPSSN